MTARLADGTDGSMSACMHEAGTIKVICHGKFEGITYSASGRLKASVVKYPP